MNLNFFGDKHGKNSRDTHFSNISKFIQTESLIKRLESSQDIADAINKRQGIANESKVLKFVLNESKKFVFILFIPVFY